MIFSYGHTKIKLSRDENFRKFRGFVAIHKNFLCDILGRGIFWRHLASNPQKKCFFRDNLIFYQFAKFFFPWQSYLPPIRESFFSVTILFATNSRKFFFRDNLIFHQFAKFFFSVTILFATNSRKFYPTKVSRFMVATCLAGRRW